MAADSLPTHLKSPGQPNFTAFQNRSVQKGVNLQRNCSPYNSFPAISAAGERMAHMDGAGISALAVKEYLIRADSDDGRQLLFAILNDGRCAVFQGDSVLYVGAGDDEGVCKGIDVLEHHGSSSAPAL
jgi:hypothetical protein